MEETLIQAISTVGFPIVACIAMFYFAFKMIEEMKTMVAKTSETNDEIAETLKEVTAQITDIRIHMALIDNKLNNQNVSSD